MHGPAAVVKRTVRLLRGPQCGIFVFFALCGCIPGVRVAEHAKEPFKMITRENNYQNRKKLNIRNVRMLSFGILLIEIFLP